MGRWQQVKDSDTYYKPISQRLSLKKEFTAYL
jgi:hypothetical protein